MSKSFIYIIVLNVTNKNRKWIVLFMYNSGFLVKKSQPHAFSELLKYLDSRHTGHSLIS